MHKQDRCIITQDLGLPIDALNLRDSVNFSDASAITRPSVLILKFSKEKPLGFKYAAETSPIVPLGERVPAADLGDEKRYIWWSTSVHDVLSDTVKNIEQTCCYQSMPLEFVVFNLMFLL